MKKKINRKTRKNNRKTRKTKKIANTLTKDSLPRCSPKLENNEFSCFDNESLTKMKNLWNAKHQDSQIITNEPKEIWTQLKGNLSSVCSKESCWLKQHFIDNSKIRKELSESFAPLAPKEWKKKPNEWLSSIDILNVMKQFEKTYKCFEFIGPSPIDYDAKLVYGETVWPELSEFDLKNQLKRGKTKIGVIFNTDDHNGGGEHWISLFINIKTKVIFFFDSAGDKCPKRVKKFINNVVKQGTFLDPQIHFTFDENHPTEHQMNDTECGVYSLYFIVHMLEDKHNGDYFKTHRLSDKYMEQFRRVYFNYDL